MKNNISESAIRLKAMIEKAIEDSHEKISVIQLVDKAERKKVKDTDTGELLIGSLKELRVLLKMYRNGSLIAKH